MGEPWTGAAACKADFLNRFVNSSVARGVQWAICTPKPKVLCVFRPGFGCAHPKAGRITLFSCFQPFCSFQTFFSDFKPEINKKTWKWRKKQLRVDKAYFAPPLCCAWGRSPRCPALDTALEINKKGWKRLKKVVDQHLGALSTQKLVEVHNTRLSCWITYFNKFGKFYLKI